MDERVKISPPYSLLGRFYDQLTPEAPAMNRHARRKTLGRILPGVRTVCDLVCGTGTTGVELARAGHKAYAVDVASTQCHQARKKSRRAGVTVRVLCADMRRFRLTEPVDLVLYEFNALNHLARKSDLSVVFRKVARTLRPGGWFYFDLNIRLTYAGERLRRKSREVAREAAGGDFPLTAGKSLPAPRAT